MTISADPPSPAPASSGWWRGCAPATSWACAASLIETCRLNDINPQHYLADVLARLAADHPASQVDALLPWEWAKGRKPDG